MPLLNMPLCVNFIVIIFLFIVSSPTLHGADNENYTTCHEKTYDCGDQIKEIRYPFWGEDRLEFCGVQGFKLTCKGNENTTIVIEKQEFRVLHINQSAHSMTIARADLWDTICPAKFINTTLNWNLFDYGPQPQVNLTLFYDCLPEPASYDQIKERSYFQCSGAQSSSNINFFVDELLSINPPNCKSRIKVPVFQEALFEFWYRWDEHMTLENLVKRGFEADYHEMDKHCKACNTSGGECGTNTTTNQAICFCHNGPQPQKCQGHTKRRIALGIGLGAVGVIVVVAIVCIIYHRRNKKYNATSSWISRYTSHTSSMNDIEKEASYYGVQTFSYNELQKATNNFDSKKEVGDGGFGTVYQGKLRDGRVVAVKRLYEHNFKRVEQFMNEIEILTRLRHPNLVSLYGFTSRHCRELLLVYEYIPNGTVADHLHGDRAKPGSLSWTTRMSIAFETASALAYLHASDVIHRDVKTNNILLDNSFCVKVADFGLSRLFPTDVTHVSTAPQGTAGYVDPEYHECYQLTNKSDVYSFGVVLIELISSKPAVDITRHRHEINLSNMAINKIQNHELHELVDPCLGFNSDYKVTEMIKVVAELAFQCLQNESDMRPSMKEVLEVLKEISSVGYDRKVADEMDIPADDVVLLKSDPPTLSPNSLRQNWVSKGSTTSNASSS
ncbi:LEAF RUST 10 DISEASE-RESISTANCE LOCUS RECEPTOR-LIKE PROTEIN KINASE-like 1.2 [Camellia lanceoleosa]|uniref:LEAF RUST 10 DISEASE-RESISTANCE LOCUS RECEPTOR-LIKE PROTEIN KINASE-like 1.2 n=1 Tax=Camellia lanceoleosa TaxID=1840588 RepID=A0ACC0FD02_9ERIC|nr:LEAF RUST 10 DISEASE-RESISTANCE LOCUS RECEPTOR-LIKE PROTEIN KINASE-like 1.2 [Camellia lanceoleosa]